MECIRCWRARGNPDLSAMMMMTTSFRHRISNFDLCRRHTLAAMASADEGTPTKAEVKVKLCAVCGDKALGYNFNALTCESCKAFFRRNALKNKVRWSFILFLNHLSTIHVYMCHMFQDFKCPFNDECEVTTVTRRFCQKCRLKKCFDIGMKKEWILSEEEKQQKREKIKENKAKKRNYSSPQTPSGPLSVAASEDDPLTPRTPEYMAASTLMDLQPGGSLGIENRPQARVLPSSRGGSDSPPAAKLSRSMRSSSFTATSIQYPPGLIPF